MRRASYEASECYLRDKVQATYRRSYLTEKESDEQSVENAVRVRPQGDGPPVEISRLRDPLKPLSQKPVDHVQYYIPNELRDQASALRRDWN